MRRRVHLCQDDASVRMLAVVARLLPPAHLTQTTQVAPPRRCLHRYQRARLQRLNLEGAKFDTLLAGLSDVKGLRDPINQVTLARELDGDGLKLYQVTCPIGVICVIFEARPEAVVQIASLAIKSANAVVLKGGKEAAHSNAVLVEALRAALETAGLPADAVQLVETREAVHELLSLDEYLDLVIPRGSNALVKAVKEATRVPVLGHADGKCSVYVDPSADEAKAVHVVVDSKINYCAACNAAEVLLVHKDVVATLLPAIGKALVAADVKLRADDVCLPHLPAEATTAAGADDFDTEFLSLTMAVKAVDNLEAAVDHINAHGSHHTDAIVTEDAAAAEYFFQNVDSAGVYHNASTRFADGFRYGLGAEVGVSTNRVHARGPVGLEGLVIYKYRIYGSGQGAGDYGVGDGKKPFKHADLTGDAAALPKVEGGAAGAGSA